MFFSPKNEIVREFLISAILTDLYCIYIYIPRNMRSLYIYLTDVSELTKRLINATTYNCCNRVKKKIKLLSDPLLTRIFLSYTYIYNIYHLFISPSLSHSHTLRSGRFRASFFPPVIDMPFPPLEIRAFDTIYMRIICIYV